MARNDRIDIEEALGAVTIFADHPPCKSCGNYSEVKVDPDAIITALDRAGFRIVRTERSK